MLSLWVLYINYLDLMCCLCMGNYKLTFMQRRYLLFIEFFFQYDPSNPPVARNGLATVDFLMDGAELSNEPFTLKFVEIQ